MNLEDNEIIKALKCCNEKTASECSECPLLKGDCSEYDLYKLALDLINRQNKTLKYQAEQIIDLKIKVKEQRAEIENLTAFADKFKDKAEQLEIEKSAMQHKIDSQKAEIEKFEKIDHFAQKTIDLQTAEIKKIEAEIERLQAEGLQINETFMGFVNKCKAEAIKEFAERLSNLTASYWLDNINKGHINNLVKEMVGDK